MDRKMLVPVLALLLLFGCVMEMKIDQTVEKNGDAKVVQTVDLSSFIKYMESMTKSLSQYSSAPKPDSTYSSAYYASIPSFESESLQLDVSMPVASGGTSDDPYPGKATSISGTLKNNGEAEISNMSIEVKSKAFVSGSYGMLEDFVSVLEKRRTERLSFSGTIANVTPGTYEATVIATFDTPSRKNVQVAQTIPFSVKSSEQAVGSSIAKMDEQFKKSCQDMMKADASVQCQYRDSIFEVSKTIQPGEEDYSFKKDEGLLETSYNVTITSVPQLSNYTPSDSTYGSLGSLGSLGSSAQTKKKFKDGFGSGADAASMSMVRSMMKMQYVVHMPGKIASAPGGTIGSDNKSVSYDVLELYDKRQDISILSKVENEGGQFMLLVGALLIAIIVIGGIFLIYRRGHTY